jgi:hypothetical protein
MPGRQANIPMVLNNKKSGRKNFPPLFFETSKSERPTFSFSWPVKLSSPRLLFSLERIFLLPRQHLLSVIEMNRIYTFNGPLFTKTCYDCFT